MRGLLCVVVTAILAVSAVDAGQSRQTARRSASSQSGTVVSGRVADASGRGIARAVIRLSSSSGNGDWPAVSDGNGRWQLSGIPQGTYLLSASKAGYAPSAFGQKRQWEPGTPLSIGGPKIELPDLILVRAGAITGVVVDADGEPVMDATVAAMKRSFLQGSERLIPMGRVAATDDLGQFRVFGLPAGEYYLTASVKGGVAAAAQSGGYAPTYYPGSADFAEAQAVRVRASAVVGPLSVTLVNVRTARVSGAAIGSDGKPIAGGVVALLQRVGGLVPGVFGGQTAGDGRFSIAGVPPGTYVISATTPPTASPESAWARVTVDGDPVEVHLAAAPPATISGSVTSDTGEPVPPHLASQLRVLAIPADLEEADHSSHSIGGSANVGADFSFAMTVRPGRWIIRVSAAAATEWRVQSVRLSSGDVSDDGLRVDPRQTIGDLAVILTRQPLQIRGSTVNAAGNPVGGQTVLVFSANREQRGIGTRRTSIAMSDDTGSFSVAGLPSGQYYAVALNTPDTADLMMPSLLEDLERVATRFELPLKTTRPLRLVVRPVSDSDQFHFNY